MAKRLFQTEFGFSDGNIDYLSGAGAPGGDASFQDAAPKGSKYTDYAATPPLQYVKVTEGSGVDMWALAISDATKVSLEVVQTAHGFTVGNWVYRDPTNTVYALADQTDPATADVIGIVSEVKDADTFTITTHGFSEVVSEHADGSPLYLDTSGSATTVKPLTGVQKNLGFVIGNTIFVAVGISIELSEDEAPGVPLFITDAVTALQAVAAVPTVDGECALWHLNASGAAGRYTAVVSAVHNRFAGGGDATIADMTEFCILEVGVPLADLAVGVQLAGTGADQQLQLVVSSTPSVQVNVRQIRT